MPLPPPRLQFWYCTHCGSLLDPYTLSLCHPQCPYDGLVVSQRPPQVVQRICYQRMASDAVPEEVLY
ncbi:hypothetical protein D6833_07355 [Candidatus Parcubacteria bacterium]|nr:MAG: hypothetical protein D6833_07355 [Candidatus Parcubacteria bacterium]